MTYQPEDRVRVINPLAPDYGRTGTVKRIDAGRSGLVWLTMDETPSVVDRGPVGVDAPVHREAEELKS